MGLSMPNQLLFPKSFVILLSHERWPVPARARKREKYRFLVRRGGRCGDPVEPEARILSVVGCVGTGCNWRMKAHSAGCGNRCFFITRCIVICVGTARQCRDFISIVGLGPLLSYSPFHHNFQQTMLHFITRLALSRGTRRPHRDGDRVKQSREHLFKSCKKW